MPKQLSYVFLILALSAGGLQAETIILRNGKKKTGEIIHMDRKSVTIQVDDYLQLRLYRAHVKEIITNKTSNYKRAPISTSFAYDPEKDKKAADVPAADDVIDPNDFRVPPPALLSLPEFEPKFAGGGQGDGRLIGADGRRLSDHQIYANDTMYFSRKSRDGMIRTTPVEERDRLSSLRYLANEIATVRHLGEDVKTGIMLESRERTQEKLADTYEWFKREATKYHDKHGRQALKEAEYPMAQWLAQMDSAVRTYNMCRNQLEYEERLSVRDRVDLGGGRTERGRMLRWRMKVSIIQMAQARSEIRKKYDYFFRVGEIPELPAAVTKKEVWTVVSENTLLFPYKDVEGSVAYQGLREDYDQKLISQAQPLILNVDQAVVLLQRKTISYPPAVEGGEPMEIEVLEIKMVEATAMSYRTKEQLPEMELRGWLLADRVKLVSR